MNSTETQTEYLDILNCWFFIVTGKTLEEVAEEQEVTVDYFVEEFLV